MTRQKNLCNSVTPYNRLCKNYCQRQLDKRRLLSHCHIHNPTRSSRPSCLKILMILTTIITIASVYGHSANTIKESVNQQQVSQFIDNLTSSGKSQYFQEIGIWIEERFNSAVTSISQMKKL